MMKSNVLRAGLLIATLAIAGCNNSETVFQDLSPKAEKQLSEKIVTQMKAKGMSRTSPIMARIFKEEGKLEIWKQKNNGRYDLIAEYDICKWSGKLGPKFTEGDRQAPEGFYTVRPAQMKPNSSYHLAFNIGYPNAYDRSHGRTGSNLMVHGACSSSGCYSMTDEQVEQIYAFGRDAFMGGQTDFQIQAFPFRMTAANMARYRKDANYDFWKMLKEGYDHFEITKVPPKVDVCEKRYVFNRIPEGGATFSASDTCPAFTQPQSLQTAYQSYQSTYDAAFSKATGKATPPKPSIGGIQEANLVSDWSRKRSRGERVSLEPPSLAQDGSVVVATERMGRVDSDAGRRMAALDAEAEAKKKVEAEKAAAIALAKAEREKAATVAAQVPAPAPANAAPETNTAAMVPSPEQAAPVQENTEVASKPGILGGVRKRLGSMLFGS